MKKIICLFIFFLSFQLFAIDGDTYKVVYINIISDKKIDHNDEIFEFIENPLFRDMYMELSNIINNDRSINHFTMTAGSKFYLNYYNGDDGCSISTGLFLTKTEDIMKNFTQNFNKFIPDKNKKDISYEYKLGALVSLHDSFKDYNVSFRNVNSQYCILFYSYKKLKVGLIFQKSFENP